MKFECGDLERALSVPDLMPDALEHAKTCPHCRRELWLWNEISRTAGGLHEEWESPELWPRIRTALAAEPKPSGRSWWRTWKLAPVPVLAAAALAAILLYPIRPPGPAPTRAFLTEQAVQEAEQAEAVYRKSIDKLATLAGPQLEKTESPLVVSYREKLILLDAAIADVKTHLERNRFNAQLQTSLAGLYRDKQQTLQEILTSEQKN
jgi:hypothetical protein